MMNALAARIAARIRTDGPMSVADYMATCLFDPEHGYYMTRQPFGRDGDFTTAPEISQMFGELVAARLYAAWLEDARPQPATFCEMGPGRGTMMRDMLRTLHRLDPAFLRASDIVMIEASERLAKTQQATLADAPASPHWDKTLAGLAPQPLYLAANELFDALPIRQYVKTERGWRERVVALSEDDHLCFAAGFGEVEAALLPPDASTASPGAIVELAPARSSLMDEIAHRIATHGGMAILIDYGYEQARCGDTLQAMHRHAFANVLENPGHADLTAHVDFGALAALAHRHGLATELIEQGRFLLDMGLLERAGRLGQDGDSALRMRLSQEVERLAGLDAMGTLFKVLIVWRPDGSANASH